jgi:RNA polymerase sigma-70 factor (ECF subfamily)
MLVIPMTNMRPDDFAALYGKQFDCVYRYTLALTGNPACAEEITQEAFARLLRDGFREIKIERPEAWLMSVARNLAVDSFRKQGRERSGLEEAPPRNPEQQLILSEMQQRILCALSKLAQSQRDCIALREFGGLSYGEIAGVTGTSVDSVKVQLFRARRHLRQELEDLR